MLKVDSKGQVIRNQKKSDFCTYFLNPCIGAMENGDLLRIGFGEFGCFLYHLLINISSDDF